MDVIRRQRRKRPCGTPIARPRFGIPARTSPNRYFRPDLFPQSGRLPVGLSGTHAGPRIYPADRGRPLFRRLHDQLAFQCLSRSLRPHLRSPCEPACRRGRVEEGSKRAQPVAICRLKRVAADYKDDIRDRLPVAAGSIGTASAIALIGAGPASLTVARDLLPLGYTCVCTIRTRPPAE